jgi:predicted ribosome quality control (RQC) complex YloA/Tae2 family protein
MLSLCELRRTVRVLQEGLAGAVLRRISQQDAYTLILTFEKSAGKSHILLSSKPDYARICLAELMNPPTFSGSFYQYTRAHLLGSSLMGIKILGEDRQIDFRLQTRSSSHDLVFSILDARSNVYLLDAEGKLMHSMRPLGETRRELKLGEAWTNPRSTTPSEGVDRWDEVPDSRYLEAITKTYQQLEKKHEIELLARTIAHALKKEREFLGRKSVNLQEDLGEARQAEITRRKGELLKSMLHTIRRGDDRVLATDSVTGKVVEILLDPKLSPAANMESYFVRYQKKTRGAKIIQQQLEDLVAQRAELDAIEEQLVDVLKGDPPNEHALERLASHRTIRRLIQRHFPKPKPLAIGIKSKGKKEIPTRLRPRRYKTQDGLEIWVGRSDEGNDYLTTRLARGNDLFFHLDGYPGSHVVLRTEGHLDPSPESLLDACELAVHFSRLKNTKSADVHIAPIKNVKKPRGAKPGLVFVRGGKTIHLRRNLKRLEGILASRLD